MGRERDGKRSGFALGQSRLDLSTQRQVTLATLFEQAETFDRTQLGHLGEQGFGFLARLYAHRGPF